ncbi:hypothetical protein BRADI_3g56035v3 [Brachypodium distachyon]|uniref:RING-type E3 ubiquitin transferase n=1 Tax=Brachypodium distachyon TaxID=15368 RepID=A0A0Q3JSQ5_BRADI|nr:hypothetical protein BRADI_3g56035v3 [Brachypodium distachyon]
MSVVHMYGWWACFAVGAWVPVSQLAEHEVAAYSKLEEDRASRALDDLLHICTSQRVRARKVIVSADDAARGLVRLADDHAVAELVMGAASDRAYTRKMCAPRSKKAVTVQRKANPACRIWFLCKGNLICTREADEVGLNRAEPSTSSSSPSPRSSSAVSDCSRSKPSMPFGMHESASAGPTTLRRRTSSRDADSDNATDHNGAEDDHLGHDASSSSAAAAADVVGAFFSTAPAASGLRDAEDQDSPAPSHHGSSDGAGEMDDDALYERLKEALVEARNLRHEAYEETRRRQKADRDLAHASRMAKEAESSWQGEARRRKETEERLARERVAMEQDRRDLDGILEKIMEVDGRSAELELQIADSERAMSQLDVRLSESYGVLDALRLECERREEPATAGEPSVPEVDVAEQSMSFWRLGLSELEEATGHFNESARIGGGGVYRGSLRGMSVAVRMVSPEVAVDEARFTRAVEAMSRARHPGLVTFLGACPEARAVVHELVPGGSLEDRLEGKEAPTLSWQARCGVAYRTCSALAYILSTGAVHGDVRPANILLEDEGCSSSKLAGFGTRGLVAAKERRRPGGVDVAYVDPRCLATGEPTPRSDVHALGVVLLRLVTGKPAFEARKAARDAAAGSTPWHEAVGHAGAGGWPVERATEVALLGLKCCAGDEDEDVAGGGATAEQLLEEARGVLEAATMAAPGRTWSSLSSASGAGSESGGGAPSYFLCPILKEVMRDPQIAGDGFTYEAEAMREWLGSGHDTSPMTNLKLPTDELLPNHALRAAIQEWRHTTTPGTSSASSDRFH